MNQIKKIFLTALLAFSIVSCASSIKEKFGADDFGMGYLNPNAKITTEVDNLFANLSDVKTKVPDSIKPISNEPINKIEKGLKQKIENVITNGNSQQLITFLEAYNIFKTESIEYPQLKVELGDKQIENDTKTANSLLKRVYKLKGSVTVSKRLIERANQDVVSIKEKNDPVKVAGISMITVTVLNNTLSASTESEKLSKELQKFTDTLQAEIKAEPALSIKLSGIISEMGNASKELATVTTDIPQLLESTNKLIDSINS